MTHRLGMVLVVLLALSISGLRAQAPPVGVGGSLFEAISVKESSGTRIPMQWQGPRLVAGGLPLQSLLIFAYQLPIYQLADLPDWVRSTRYEINALATRVPAPAEQTAFLRALLAERFGIVTRTETHERPMYALVLARQDGRLGPRLRPSSFDCIAIMTARSAGRSSQDAAGPDCRIVNGAGAYSRDGIPLAALVDMLSNRLERPVVDRTGLTGLFDINLRFRPLAIGAAPTSGADEPDLLTALEEQLGLKAESLRGPVQVTVFERIQRPTPD